MATELRKCNKLSWALCDGDCEKCRTFATTEAIYNRYTDTAGNYHWTGVYSGEHIVKMNEGERREDEWQEPDINPCRGCDDYDGQGGCKSNGGCGTKTDEVTDE